MVQGDGIVLSGDGRTAHKNAQFLPTIQKSGSYPTCDGESDCRATWSECGDTAQMLSAEVKSEGDIIIVKGVVREEKI